MVAYLRWSLWFLCAMASLTALASCSDQGSAPPAIGEARAALDIDVTGTWVGSLGGQARPYQLHQRADGRIIGYPIAGTATRSILAGQVTGSSLSLTIGHQQTSGVQTFQLAGPVSGDTWTATVTVGSSSQTQTWARTTEVFDERHFIFAASGSGGNASSFTEIAVALHGSGGGLVGGVFAGENGSCGLFACSGSVTAFSESGGVLTMSVENGGLCAGSGSFTATFNSSSKLYSGTYSYTMCGQTTSGSIIGARMGNTNSSDAAGVLAAIGRVADDLQARTAFTSGHPSFSSSYLHDGAGLSTELSALNAEEAGYNPIDVRWGKFRNLCTIADPDAFPDVALPIGVDFDTTWVGHPAGGGADVTFAGDTSDVCNRQLKYLHAESSAWKIYGNQAAQPVCIPHCAAGATPLTNSPLASGDLVEIISLGHVEPAGHTFPTDHMYLTIRPISGTTTPSLVTVYAPGTGWITEVSSSHSALDNKTDYDIKFSPCGELQFQYGHFTYPNTTILQAFNNSPTLSCHTYNPSGVSGDDFTRCTATDLRIPITAGDTIGQTGGTGAQGTGLDFWAWDARVAPLAYVSPARFYQSPDGFDSLHITCGLDYCTPTLRSTLASLLTRDVAGSQPASSLVSMCGEVMQDLASKAQGLWYVDTSSPATSESNQLALVHFNDKNRAPGVYSGVLSVGNVSNWTGGYVFVPTHTGLTNRDFAEVTADGNTYCYDGFTDMWQNPISGKIFLVRMPTSSTLDIERQTATSCASSAKTFVSPVHFVR